MKNGFFTPNFIVISAMIAVAALTRFLPHPPNFTAISALALFGAANLNDKRFAFLIPVLAMAITDLFIPGGYDLAVYSGFIVVVLIGFMLRKKVAFKNVILASLTSSVVFYLITNFLFLYSAQNTFYPRNFQGLIESYIAAIPFFRNALLGDLFFSGIFFGSYAILKKNYTVLAK